MRKIIKVIISLICCGVTACVIAVSCGIDKISGILNLKETSEEEYDPRKWEADDKPFGKETMLKVLKCFDEKDKETLKSMFSVKKVSSCHDLDKRIDKAMNYYEGKSVSYDEPRCSAGDAHFNRDHYEYKEIQLELANVSTDTGKSFRKIWVWYTLVADNASKIGISQIQLKDENDESILLI